MGNKLHRYRNTHEAFKLGSERDCTTKWVTLAFFFARRLIDALTLPVPKGTYSLPKVISQLFVTIDMYARMKSPGYYGHPGPEFCTLLKSNNEKPHRKLIGRKTYDLLNSLRAGEHDKNCKKATQRAGLSVLAIAQPMRLPRAAISKRRYVAFVRKLKQHDGSELRVLGSLSIVRQLLDVGLLDVLRLMVCPLVLPESGVDPVFRKF